VDGGVPPARYAQSGDLSIAYQVIGNGPRDLIVVPPIISHIELLWELPGYRRWVERLSRFGRVLLFDKRGQGLSDRPGGATTLEERIDDVRAVMDSASSGRAVLIGISEGGPTSILFAATHPARVERLVLCGTFALGVGPTDEGGFTANMEVAAQIAEAMAEAWGSGAVMAGMLPSASADHAELFAKVERFGSGPAAIHELWQMTMRIDVRAVLPSIGVPTLVMRRSEEIAPSWTSEYLAKHIGGARYVEVRGPDHFPYGRNVDAYVDVIEEFVTGEIAEEPDDVDRVLATVLFADIADSTARAASMGDRAWRDVLDRFHVAVGGVVGQHRGRVVNSRGDDVLATFDGPARAVRAAQAIARVSRVDGLAVRSGLHTGEVELRGGDVAGMAVHIGARVAALAAPGEILVTSTVRDLAIGSGIEFDERGVHSLRGVPGTWALLSVAAQHAPA
jgi:class 3 adenylate cyclase/pimeloyl-ACP methyl ester carboxylesterase